MAQYFGHIKWNFKEWKMEFYFEGKGHVLSGLRGQKVKLIHGKELPKAMANASHLCLLQLIPQQSCTLKLVRVGSTCPWKGVPYLWLLNYSSNLKIFSKSLGDYLLAVGFMTTESP